MSGQQQYEVTAIVYWILRHTCNKKKITHYNLNNVCTRLAITSYSENHRFVYSFSSYTFFYLGSKEKTGNASFGKSWEMQVRCKKVGLVPVSFCYFDPELCFCQLIKFCLCIVNTNTFSATLPSFVDQGA